MQLIRSNLHAGGKIKVPSDVTGDSTNPDKPASTLVIP